MPRLIASFILASGAFFVEADPAIQRGLFLFVLAALLWLTEALHLTVTALLIPVLASVAGVLEPRQAFAAFADPVIALFFGGFVLASALRRHGLDAFLAARLLRLARGRLLAAALALFGATAFISMWISNTASAAMMLPLALGLLAGVDPKEQRGTWLFVLLGIAWMASLGGMGSLVGSPPNALAAAATGVSFREWFAFGLPLMLLLVPGGALVLWWLFRPANLHLDVSESAPAFRWTPGARAALAVFALAVAGWLFSEPLSGALGIARDMDSLIALAAAVLLLATGTLGWENVQRDVDWGVLLLFGGGLCLGVSLKISGASDWLAAHLLAAVEDLPRLFLLLSIATFIVFLSELASNTAATALLLPLLLPLSSVLGMPDAQLAAFIALTASCGFMLPVATPPNAIVFGSGHVRQREMMRAGFVMNLVCIIAITAFFA